MYYETEKPPQCNNRLFLVLAEHNKQFSKGLFTVYVITDPIIRYT